MARFLVDEDLPRSLARALTDLGKDARDVRDVGLRSRPDEAVMEFAVREGLTIVTGDLGFGNEIRFPPGSHAGVVVARLPNEMPTSLLNARIMAAIDDLPDDLSGCIVIVEPDRVRLRRRSG